MNPTPDEVVKGLLRLRDFKKAVEDRHKAELEPINAKLRVLENYLLNVLNEQHADNMKTRFGTFYRNTKINVSVHDPMEFRNFVVKEQRWNLADVRANKPGVHGYVEQNNEAPPGVNYSEYLTVGVRSANGAHLEEVKRDD